MGDEIEKAVRAAKHDIIRGMFIDTADENYITARFCFIQGLNTDFYWLSLHSVEKYLKAILLYNEVPRMGKGNDICGLYSIVLQSAPKKFFTKLKRPKPVVKDDWAPESVKGFIKRLNHFGNPDNRYDAYGYVRLSDELFKLDQVVYQIRRLFNAVQYAPGLGDHYISEFQRNQSYWRLHQECNLEKAVDGKRGPILQQTATNHNFAFVPEQQQSSFVWNASFRNSPIYMNVILPLERGGDFDRSVARRVKAWLIEKVKLPGDVKADLCKAEERSRP